jgi:hypothetical protein
VDLFFVNSFADLFFVYIFADLLFLYAVLWIYCFCRQVKRILYKLVGLAAMRILKLSQVQSPHHPTQ